MLNVLAHRIAWRSTTLAGADALLVFVSLIAAMALLKGDFGWLAVASDGTLLSKAAVVAGVCGLCLYARDLYDLAITADRKESLVRVLQSLGAACAAVAVLYLWFPALVIGNGVFGVSALLLLLLITSWRAAFHWLYGRVWPRDRLLLVGTGSEAIALAMELSQRKAYGVDCVGLVEVDSESAMRREWNAHVIGTIDDLPAIVRARGVDRVVVSLADARGKLPIETLLELKLQGVAFDDLASVYEQYTGKIAIAHLRPSWLIFSSGFQKSRLRRTTKRLMDAVVAATGIALLAPVGLAIAAAIKLTSAGPVLYRQQRVGLDGRIFTILKFRSMRHDAEAESGPTWARSKDPRVTPIGRVLRLARLDELPQLWNVLAGEMSLVGPRPERPEFVRELSREIPFYGLRHVVKPGISGWAQVRYTYAASVEDALKKLQFDLFYIKNMSLALDLYILVRTVKVVALGRGAC